MDSNVLLPIFVARSACRIVIFHKVLLGFCGLSCAGFDFPGALRAQNSENPQGLIRVFADSSALVSIFCALRAQNSKNPQGFTRGLCNAFPVSKNSIFDRFYKGSAMPGNATSDHL